MGFISLFVVHRLSQMQHQTTAQDFEKTKRMYNNEINLHALMLAAEVRASSLMPRLRSVFWRIEERQTDFAVLSRIYGRAQIDLLLLTDLQGILLFDASDMTLQGDDLTHFPGVQTNANPSDFTGIWQYQGHFYNIAISAVWQNRAVVGQVIIGKRLSKIGESLSIVTEKNVYLLHQNKLISHFTIMPESLPPAQSEIADIAQKIAQNTTSDQTYTHPFQTSLGGQNGLALALPFPTPQTYAIFFRTTSRSEIELLRTRNWILMGFCIGLVPLAFVSWWLSGQITYPIYQMSQAAKQLENGQLEISVPIHTQYSVATRLHCPLTTWVANGGTALFLNLPAMHLLSMKEGKSRMSRYIDKDVFFPFALSLYTGKGLWTPCSHVVKDHPFYDGLPSNCLMGQEYRNISSQWSIVEPKTNWIGGNITYDWYAGLKHKQNYIGVTEAFHGADLTQIAHGNGKYILCTHRIVENLGKDPVADRLLSNLLNAHL